MKLERNKKNYGGGSGREIFESDLFRVVCWRNEKGNKTVIECKLSDNKYIQFDGHHDLKTDQACMEQIEPSEILEMIECQKENSFQKGKDAKALEIRQCLGIDTFLY